MTEQVGGESEIKELGIKEPDTIFQAIGIVVGQVNLRESGQNTITIGDFEYPLFFIPKKRTVFLALSKEIEVSGNLTQRLVVYPKVIHFPDRNQPYQLSFQLVGFDQGRFNETVSEELRDMEFKISGLWQFIPVCQTPCVSIFRNFSHERLEYIKQVSPAQKVRYMKGTHVPLLWKDSPIRPFRFDRKIPKEEQGHSLFVSLKAKFLPERSAFEFVALLAPPQETPPRFLKASKQDKSTVRSAANNNPRSEQTPNKKKVSVGIPQKNNSAKLPSPVKKSASPIPKPIKKVSEK